MSPRSIWGYCPSEESSASMRAACTPRFIQLSALLLVFSLITTLLGLAFVPWQQTVNGVGTITVQDPLHRPQTVNSSIAGRIKRWYVQEGDTVEPGQILVQLEEIKIAYLSAQLLERLAQTKASLLDKEKALVLEADALRQERLATNSQQRFKAPSAISKQNSLNQKVNALKQKRLGLQTAYETARLNLERRQQLMEEGLRSRRDFELAQKAEAKAKAALRSNQLEIESLEQQTEAARFTAQQVGSDFDVKRATIDAKLAKTQQALATIRYELQQIGLEIDNQEARREQAIVRAPIGGKVVRAEAVGPGVTVKEGEPLATILPQSTDRVAALFVDDFNAPLVSVGQQVRLQIAGWPALQFSGFPQASLGTFAGKVLVVDAISDIKGQFRVLVGPDSEAIDGGEQPWPEPHLLRPGIQTSGWLMIKTVPLGFELWRRFNGFPPTLMPESKKKKATSIKSNAVKGSK